MMFAQVSNLNPANFVHVIADCHILRPSYPHCGGAYKPHPLPLPKVELNKSITNFYDFTPESFIVTDYKHGESIGRFEVAV